MVKAVRGAVMVENTETSIRQWVTRLLSGIVGTNALAESDIVSIIFSQTTDIDALNPATALRSAGFSSVPLFCTQEPRITGAPTGLVRVLVTCNTDREQLVPVYLNGAEVLRRDLFGSGPQD